MNASLCLNRLLRSPEGLFFTVVKDPKRRKNQFSIHRADQTYTFEGVYQRKIPRDMPVFGGGFSQVDLSQDAATKILEDWKLQPVEIFNGYPEAFLALSLEATRRELPKDYRTDLDIDKKQLWSPGWCSREFLWCLRTYGTHMVSLDAENLRPDRGSRAQDCVKAIQRFGDQEMYWYVYDGQRLREITAEKAREIATEADYNAEQQRHTRRATA